MKIVDRKTFLSLPVGALFSDYEPCIFGELLIKGESWSEDYFTQKLSSAISCSSSDEFGKILEHARETGASVAMDFSCEARDGCFNEDQLYAVWERGDVEALIQRLQLACKEYP